MTEKVPSEDHEQMMFVKWFRQNLKPVRIFAIPSGGHRHIAVATKMKATGTVRGIPDMFVPSWLLWIEMKRQKGGKVDPDQAALLEKWGKLTPGGRDKLLEFAAFTLMHDAAPPRTNPRAAQASQPGKTLKNSK
jgi:hypothetical protein